MALEAVAIGTVKQVQGVLVEVKTRPRGRGRHTTGEEQHLLGWQGGWV
jgi:hypothetical protein